jgi:hypothetical protein
MVLARDKIHAHAYNGIFSRSHQCTAHFREGLLNPMRTYRSSSDVTCYLSRLLAGAFESVLTDLPMFFHKRVGLELVQFLGVQQMANHVLPVFVVTSTLINPERRLSIGKQPLLPVLRKVAKCCYV